MRSSSSSKSPSDTATAKKKGPVLAALLSEDGFSVTYPQNGRRRKRCGGPAGGFSHIQTNMPTLMQIVEITDADGKPLMCMPPDAVIRQKLYRRIVCVAVRSTKNTIYLHKRAEPMPDSQGLWDIYSGPVLMGEAREDAALRLLWTQTGIASLPLAEVAAKRGNFEHPSHLTLFTADLPARFFFDPEGHETMQVDADELAGLAAHAPELFTPTLLWAAGTGCLFRE